MLKCLSVPPPHPPPRPRGNRILQFTHSINLLVNTTVLNGTRPFLYTGSINKLKILNLVDDALFLFFLNLVLQFCLHFFFLLGLELLYWWESHYFLRSPRFSGLQHLWDRFWGQTQFPHSWGMSETWRGQLVRGLCKAPPWSRIRLAGSSLF